MRSQNLNHFKLLNN
uniref:Uncharacterized protein n=1 Tax=Rhizophora mucronata TaxID=61149 RepID=A0A2P2PDR4_RHIMU